MRRRAISARGISATAAISRSSAFAPASANSTGSPASVQTSGTGTSEPGGPAELKVNRAARGLETPAKPPDHLSHAFEVAAEGAPAGEVPADVLGVKLALQCVEVASPESREAFPHQILVGMCHLIPPLDQVDPTILLHPRLAVKI